MRILCIRHACQSACCYSPLYLSLCLSVFLFACRHIVCFCLHKSWKPKTTATLSTCFFVLSALGAVVVKYMFEASAAGILLLEQARAKFTSVQSLANFTAGITSAATAAAEVNIDFIVNFWAKRNQNSFCGVSWLRSDQMSYAAGNVVVHLQLLIWVPAGRWSSGTCGWPSCTMQNQFVSNCPWRHLHATPAATHTHTHAWHTLSSIEFCWQCKWQDNTKDAICKRHTMQVARNGNGNENGNIEHSNWLHFAHKYPHTYTDSAWICGQLCIRDRHNGFTTPTAGQLHLIAY